MGWWSGSPGVPASSPGPAAEGEGAAHERQYGSTANAYVPPTARMAPGSGARALADGLLFLAVGTGYLVLVVLLVAVEGLQGWVQPGMTLPSNLLDLRDLLAELGWFGFTLSGLSLYFVTTQIGIPYRPTVIARVHLGLANLGLIGYAVTTLVWGAGATASAFLFLVGASYMMFTIPFMLALMLALQDWIAGDL